MKITSKQYRKWTAFLSYWLLLHAALILASILWYVLSGSVLPFLLLSWASLLIMAFGLRKEWRNDYFLGGPANWITWFRLMLITIFLVQMHALGPWPLAILGWSVILLDAFDGALARRFETSSIFGAYLDKEIDAIFVMAVAILLYERSYAGSWILGLGLIRFVFAFVNHFFKAPQEQDSRMNYARLIAGIIMVGMPTALIAPSWLYKIALPLMGILLAYSFLRGLYHQIQASARINDGR